MEKCPFTRDKGCLFQRLAQATFLSSEPLVSLCHFQIQQDFHAQLIYWQRPQAVSSQCFCLRTGSQFMTLPPRPAGQLASVQFSCLQISQKKGPMNSGLRSMPVLSSQHCHPTFVPEKKKNDPHNRGSFSASDLETLMKAHTLSAEAGHGKPEIEPKEAQAPNSNCCKPRNGRKQYRLFSKHILGRFSIRVIGELC